MKKERKKKKGWFWQYSSALSGICDTIEDGIPNCKFGDTSNMLRPNLMGIGVYHREQE